MLIKAKTLQGYILQSLDGDIGKVSEFYFDDTYWTIRYLIADTGLSPVKWCNKSGQRSAAVPVCTNFK